ncbi:MAG: glycosyltransferase family 2 protein [Nanoarchaeota archaeon]|nr:glycosyltransferase family 2 protein [Nanoarchaeota archaeon]
MNILSFYIDIILVTITTFITSVLFITLIKNWNVFFIDPKPIRYPSVTIAVPAMNEEKSISKTLKCLLNLDYPKKVNIIVINDGSTDNTLKIVKTFPVKIISKKKNQGKSKALNDALKVCKTEIFGFIDAETFIEKDALIKMFGYFNDKKVGAVIPPIYVYKPTSCLEKLQQIEYVFSMMTRKVLTFINSLFVTPGCAFYRTAVLKKIGGFDEKTMGEDLEVGLKINMNGYKIENSINTRVWTVVPKTIKQLIRQRVRWYRGIIYNAMKYRKLFFKKSDMGLFILPVLLAGGMVAMTLYVFLLGITLVEFLVNIFTYVFGFVLSNYTIISYATFEPNIFLVFTIFLLGVFVLNIYFSEKITKISIFRWVKEMIIFMLFYSPIICIALIISIFKTIFRREEKW